MCAIIGTKWSPMLNALYNSLNTKNRNRKAFQNGKVYVLFSIKKKPSQLTGFCDSWCYYYHIYSNTFYVNRVHVSGSICSQRNMALISLIPKSYILPNFKVKNWDSILLSNHCSHCSKVLGFFKVSLSLSDFSNETYQQAGTTYSEQRKKRYLQTFHQFILSPVFSSLLILLQNLSPLNTVAKLLKNM